MFRAILEVSGALFWLNVWGLLWMLGYARVGDWWARRAAARAFLKSLACVGERPAHD